MGKCDFFGRLVLVVINLILVIVSLALIVFGFLVKYASDIFSKYTQKVLDQIKESAGGTFSNVNINLEQFDLGELFGGVATVLIVIGFILFALSFFGCCGAICTNKAMLTVYSIVLMILIVAQIVFVVLLFAFPDVLKAAVSIPLKELLKNYEGLNGTNVESIGWNFIMQEFQCCGVDNYTDFKGGHTKWFGEDDTDWHTPLACCKTLPSSNSPADLSCAKFSSGSLNSALNNFDEGCVDAMWEKLLQQNKTYTYLGVCGIIGFQVLLTIFAIVLCCKKDDNKVSPLQQRGKRNARDEW